MPNYIFLIIAMLLTSAILFLRFYLTRGKSSIGDLFVEALRNENSGHFEAAVITYKNALQELRKNRFHGKLEIKISKKLKLLHSIIEYKNNFRGYKAGAKPLAAPSLHNF